MKTLIGIPHFTDPGIRKLVGEWQAGPETLSGRAQRKLRLTFAPLPAQSAPRLTTNYSYEHARDFSNGTDHLPLWWIRR
jgi:hypothetical protein